MVGQPTPAQQEAVHRLLTSEGWQYLLRDFIGPRYTQLSYAVDTSREDVRFAQGQKAEATFWLTSLYTMAGLESPLTAHPLGHVSPQLRHSRVEPQEDTPAGETAEVKETNTWTKTSEPHLRAAPPPRTTHPV